MITTIKTFKTTIKARKKGKIRTDLLGSLEIEILQRETSITTFKWQQTSKENHKSC